MSSDDTDHIEDKELEAFLRGEDALSQRLRALPQAEPPDALDAAILARAQQAVRPEAANDAAPGVKSMHQPVHQPLHRRWRVPAGLAAVLLAGVLTHRTWEATNQMAQVDAPAAVPAPPPPAAPAVPAQAQEVVPPAPPARTPAAPRTEARSAPVPQPTPQLKVAQPPAQPSPPPQPAPPAPVAAPAPPPQPAPPAPAPSGVAESTISHAANVAPPAPAPPSTRVTVTGSRAVTAPAPSSDVTPADWLGLIEEMLDAGLKADTLAEWAAFRAAHPDYPVDPKLEERINALRNR